MISPEVAAEMGAARSAAAAKATSCDRENFIMNVYMCHRILQDRMFVPRLWNVVLDTADFVRRPRLEVKLK